MYCVKCGVRLNEGVTACPLCRTPVWNPETKVEPTANYSARYPRPPKSKRYPILAFITILLAAVCLSVLIYCLNQYGQVAWSGYVMLGVALVYFSMIFPFWFEKRHPLIFVPLAFLLTCGYLLYICLYNHGNWFLPFAFPVVMILGAITTASVALVYFSMIFPFWFEKRYPMVFVPLAFVLICGYLLYICLYNHGHWFLPFAFPVVMLTGAITTASVALFRCGKRRRLLKTGCLVIVIGCSSMLVEMFESITFGTEMFTWSLYQTCVLSLVGLFLILSGVIPPWREYLERKLFF